MHCQKRKALENTTSLVEFFKVGDVQSYDAWPLHPRHPRLERAEEWSRQGHERRLSLYVSIAFVIISPTVLSSLRWVQALPFRFSPSP